VAPERDEGKVTIRKLGRHEEGVCDCRATTGFLNGNNISLAADLVPRSVTCRLDRKSEHPEQHTFKTNPMELVRADRGKYLAAVFTLVKAFRSAKISVKLEDDKAFIEIDGTRTEMKHVAGFEQWSKLVQAALIWLGMKDPMGAMERTRALDETQEEVVHLLDTLYSAFDNSPFNVIDCKNRADAGNQAFKELMANKKSEVDTRAFGQKLRRSRNKVRGRLSLVLDESDHEGSKWKIAGSRPL
jgi:hypothetical protein